MGYDYMIHGSMRDISAFWGVIGFNQFHSKNTNTTCHPVLYYLSKRNVRCAFPAVQRFHIRCGVDGIMWSSMPTTNLGRTCIKWH
jgi:hypothetical protein